jgi:hypothetical protein
MRAIWKVTSHELLTEQAIKTYLLYTKNMYMLKLLLNLVAARSEALDTFHQLFFIGEVL